MGDIKFVPEKVESFLERLGARLQRIEETEKFLGEALKVVERLESLHEQARRLDALSRLKQVVPSSVDELLDPERARDLLDSLREVLKEALLEAISKTIGIVDVRQHTRFTNPDELFKLYEGFMKLLNSVENRNEIKELIVDNIVRYDEKIEDVLNYRERLLKYDEALSRAGRIKISFYEGDLHDLVSSCIKGRHLRELDQLPDLLQVLEDLSRLEPPRGVDCGRYRMPLVVGWCRRYNERLRRFLDLLKSTADILRKFDLAMISELKDLNKSLKDAEEDIKGYCEELASRIYRIAKLHPSLPREFEKLLEVADERVAELRLSSTQQRILELLAEKRNMSLEELVNKLQGEGLRGEEVLTPLYDLCFKGIVKCTAEL